MDIDKNDYTVNQLKRDITMRTKRKGSVTNKNKSCTKVKGTN